MGDGVKHYIWTKSKGFLKSLWSYIIRTDIQNTILTYVYESGFSFSHISTYCFLFTLVSHLRSAIWVQFCDQYRSTFLLKWLQYTYSAWKNYIYAWLLFSYYIRYIFAFIFKKIQKHLQKSQKWTKKKKCFATKLIKFFVSLFLLFSPLFLSQNFFTTTANCVLNVTIS